MMASMNMLASHLQDMLAKLMPIMHFVVPHSCEAFDVYQLASSFFD